MNIKVYLDDFLHQCLVCGHFSFLHDRHVWPYPGAEHKFGTLGHLVTGLGETGNYCNISGEQIELVNLAKPNMVGGDI